MACYILFSFSHYWIISTVNLSEAGASFQCFCTFWHFSTAIATQKPSKRSQRKYVTYLKNSLLMDTDKVQCFCQKVVSKCFKKAFHQWHGETIDPRPRGGIQRLSRWSRCLNKSDTKINDLFTLLSSVAHITNPPHHFGSLQCVGVAAVLPNWEDSTPAIAHKAGHGKLSWCIPTQKEAAPTWMAPLVLSWYTLKRGRQTLCVTPAPATAAAPYKTQNKLLLKFAYVSALWD